LSASAQFVNGLGIFLSGMAGRQKFKDESELRSIGSHKSKYIFRPAGGILADLGRNENAKWRTEFEYNSMGSKEKINIEGNDKTFRNKLDYLSWNNFFKLQVETFSGYPYFMLGFRSQYLLKNRPEIYQDILNQGKKFHFSWDIAGGFEFMAYGSFRFFTEYHLVNDIPSFYKKNDLRVRNLTHELRVGLMYRFIEKMERCNTPIYNDNY
jgi:hypothetical protein